MGIPDVYTHEIKRKLVGTSEKTAAAASTVIKPPFDTLPVSQFADYKRK